jgi:hypothetical protein
LTAGRASHSPKGGWIRENSQAESHLSADHVCSGLLDSHVLVTTGRAGSDLDMIKFKARIEIIGVNPYVYLPDRVLRWIFVQAGKDKGKIPVRMKIDGHEFPQTLIKWSGAWRLYLNTPMRKAAKKDVGDTANFEIAYDPAKRTVPMHPKFAKALRKNKEAKQVYDSLRPSLQLEINRYFSFLKSEDAVDRNVVKAIKFLLGKGRFVARDTPK